MLLRVFDMLKIGVGPFSTHANGLSAILNGSLALAGARYATHRAAPFGHAGFHPDTYVAEHAETALDVPDRT